MRIDADVKSLPIFEAMASEVRLDIIKLLSVRQMNIKEIARELSLSSAIITMHVSKLEKAGIIKTQRVKSNGGVQRLCTLSVDLIEICFPKQKIQERKYYQIIIPVGHYTDFNVQPTCGLATAEKIIGYFDDPRFFLHPERMDARVLWFGKGFVEYKIPNYLLPGQKPEELEISMEICSEAPGVNNNWPSDITFYVNETKLGMWTSPGDFGKERGIYTPKWWSTDVNQFGLLKVIKINNSGTFIDGQKVSDINIENISLDKKQWTLKIAVEEGAEHVGGVSLFGKGFGNYDQDIVVKVFYS